MTDAMLVQEYAESRSPRPLAELAARHADWVYSAALRMMHDADLAQDVTQAAFLVLVQKAQTLGDTPVNAWLFRVTRFAAKHALRDRARRKKHEGMAAMMFKTQSAETWMAVAPLLDELVGRLNESDRRAILLRFYQGKSMAEVGSTLGISEDAAKKRVAKAVKRLRELFSGRGANVPADVLGIVLLNHTTQAAPANLAAKWSNPVARAVSISNGVISMMALARIKVAALVVLAMGLVPAALAMALQNSPPPATMPAVAQSDAADLYRQAFIAIKVDSPAATAINFPNFPPSSPQWRSMEAIEWAADAHVRELTHQARSLATINWPELRVSADIGYYNGLRNLANHIGDAAVYADMQGNDAQAAQLIGDLSHLGNLLLDAPGHQLYRVLTGAGINAAAMNRLEIIASGVTLTNDPQNTHDLQLQAANELIGQLLDRTDSMVQSESVLRKTYPPEKTPYIDRAVETIKRVSAEDSLAAMSLACHVFQFDKGRWPDSLDELVPAYLPRATIDPWGDGKQTLGYALIKGGRPDGSDRPLVFSRANSSDGLLYLANQVEYAFYFGDGTDRQGKQGGEFRDVSRWEPIADYTGSAMRPLPAGGAGKGGATGAGTGPGTE
jgi:RNA polymerase sigma factor (sigma-70 family)